MIEVGGGVGREAFLCPTCQHFFGRQARFAHGEHQNKRTTDNKYKPQKAPAKCLFCLFHRPVNRKCCCVGRCCSHTAESTERHRKELKKNKKPLNARMTLFCCSKVQRRVAGYICMPICVEVQRRHPRGTGN